MSEQSAKPYLVRAICEWCADNGLTPYLAVKVNGETRVPQGFVKNGEIVLNVSHSATRKLTIDNDWIRFTARFNGSSQ
jgi:stringent starvation protein B